MASSAQLTGSSVTTPSSVPWGIVSPHRFPVFGSSKQGHTRRRWRARAAAPLVAAGNQPLLTPRSQELVGDPFALLLKQRIIFLGGEVSDFTADAIVSQLLLLDAQDQTKDIKIFINSPGGSVTAGLGIYDAMQLCRADVATYSFGLAASMGAFLLCAGTPGKRFSMPNTRIMIHQPLGGVGGRATEVEIQTKEIMYLKAQLNRILADATGQTIEKIEEDTDRDNFMSPIEARNYGLIDHIIGGEEAVFKIVGDPSKYAKSRPEYITWTEDLPERTERGGRFTSPMSDPYTPNLYPEENESFED